MADPRLLYAFCHHNARLTSGRTLTVYLILSHNGEECVNNILSPDPDHLKPATGRSYVPAFSLSGTVPAFTGDCLRIYATTKVRPVCVYVFENNACVRK